jgi:hypothetical protein
MEFKQNIQLICEHESINWHIDEVILRVYPDTHDIHFVCETQFKHVDWQHYKSLRHLVQL